VHSPADRVVVTGIGAVTPFGIGRHALWDGIVTARSAARRIEEFDVARFPTPFACPVDDAGFDPGRYVQQRKSVKLMSRATRFAVAAAHLALEDAGLADPRLRDPLRCGVIHGAGGVGLHDRDHLEVLMALSLEIRGNGHANLLDLATRHMNPITPLKILPNIAAAHIAIEHDLRGENATLCTACTSGTQAIGEALRTLRADRADVMLAGGSDAMINPMGLIGFGMLGVLSTHAQDPERASRPFDANRDGFVMGEGSALVVLEREAHARRRGAPVLAVLEGYGVCADAYRITDERADGAGCAEAMRRALTDAGVQAGQIDYVNAHGTGTRMNDRTEVRAIRDVFGDHANALAVSSTKSQFGHLIAAAGAAELCVCVLAIQHQTLPPTINHRTPDPECDLDVVPNAARPRRLERILSNSFGFGGQNACLVLARREAS
jgi:3-oxoacyl-[acyl-carrier-protein] synthase II